MKGQLCEHQIRPLTCQEGSGCDNCCIFLQAQTVKADGPARKPCELCGHVGPDVEIMPNQETLCTDIKSCHARIKKYREMAESLEDTWKCQAAGLTRAF